VPMATPTSASASAGSSSSCLREPDNALDIICHRWHITAVWTVELAPEFEPELLALQPEVRIELLAQARVVEQFGPTTGRPRVDTLKGSKHANMKELRFDAAGGVWRVAFAFDPERKALLLAAGDKSGKSERAFYRRLIAVADRRLDAHHARLKQRRKPK
jgi:hypothetical protein